MFGQRFIGEPCQRIGGSRERLIPATLGRDLFEDPRSERVLFFHGQLGSFGKRPHEEIGHSSTFVNGGLLPRLSYHRGNKPPSSPAPTPSPRASPTRSSSTSPRRSTRT